MPKAVTRLAWHLAAAGGNEGIVSLLLQRLVLTFDAPLWNGQDAVWDVSLKFSISDLSLQVWNQDVYLLVVYQRLRADDG